MDQVEDINKLEDTLKVDREKYPAKHNYPKVRRFKEQAEIEAICCLRSCAGLSFIAITRLLGLKDSSKRNTEYTFERNKDFFKCNQVVELEKKLKK